MSNANFKHLFVPKTIGSMTVRNRIVVPAHSTLFMPLDAPPSERMVRYWVTKARGGAGLIITQVHNVHPRHGEAPPTVMQHDGCIDAYKAVTDAVHAEGAKFLVQLNHMGAEGSSRPFGGGVSAPSPIASPRGQMVPLHVEVPHEMTNAEVKEVVKAFGESATRARKMGFDGVELQGEGGYLLAQFMSPQRNHRTDEYGGSLDNRLRFVLEVMAAVRESLGTDRVLGIRVAGDEFLDGGNRLEQMLEIIPRLEATGHLDYIHVGAGPGFGAHVPPSYIPVGGLVYLTEAFRKVVKLPLICSNRINDPVLADEILDKGIADLISMNRALMVDPEMPNKAAEGRLNEIRKCIACNECIGRHEFGMPVACTMNPEMGREAEYTFEKTDSPKRILVVGAGPAGCELARVAATRGHKVSVFEKADKLGGQTLLAAKAPGRSDFERVHTYYSSELERLEVDLRLGTEVTTSLIEQEGPDVLVIATGSKPRIPDVELSEDAVVSEARAVLSGDVEIRSGTRVVVVAGEHHIQALSTADFLANQGCKVEVITTALFAGAKLETGTLERLYRRLYEQDVGFTTMTAVHAVEGKTVVTRQVITNKEKRLAEVDLVVFAYGGVAEHSLQSNVPANVGEVHLIGDAMTPRRLMDAILDGARLGHKI